MSLSIGIVGLPNVGKSTLFNALLKKQAALAANYPFATIEPNIGMVDVKDPRLQKLAEFVQNDYGRKIGDREVPEKIIPAVIKFYDIAGLVKGASEGEGLGNEFLGHIREVDAILHLVKAFKDDNIIETGTGDPNEDIEIINTELILSDLQSLSKRLPKLKDDQKGNKSTEITRKIEILSNIEAVLNVGKMANSVELSDDDLGLIFDTPMLTMKPMIHVFNVSEEDITQDSDYEPIIAKYHGVKISAKIESELSSLSESDQIEFMKDLGIKESSLDVVVRKCYEILSLQSYLTMGPKEVRAWTVTKGTKAPQAAAKIHTDFEKGFISAEIINYGDILPFESLKKAKEKGLVRLEGKEYVMRDGDIVEFRFNV